VVINTKFIINKSSVFATGSCSLNSNWLGCDINEKFLHFKDKIDYFIFKIDYFIFKIDYFIIV